MKKHILFSITTILLTGYFAVSATASPLVTANVPLDSRYYRYIDKLEGMGYIKDMRQAPDLTAV